MEERLKQRLVGAVVLVSLAVVFVPILFDMPGEVNEETSTTRITEIPLRPQDRFESPANDTLDAPRTPRLDTEVERERSRNAPEADAGERGTSSKPHVADSTSSPSAAPASTQTSGATERPASGTGSEPSIARSDPAPAAAKPAGGPEGKQAVKAPAAGGWTVQLGSFLKSENALALRKRLQARGFSAFIESGSTARGEVSRVLVGPMPDREQAKSSAAKLKREMELEGIVVPYPGG